ncbi:hypothetical protein PT2222_230136 [Paraburkholderia tropica]
MGDRREVRGSPCGPRGGAPEKRAKDYIGSTSRAAARKATQRVKKRAMRDGKRAHRGTSGHVCCTDATCAPVARHRRTRLIAAR